MSSREARQLDRTQTALKQPQLCESSSPARNAVRVSPVLQHVMQYGVSVDGNRSVHRHLSRQHSFATMLVVLFVCRTHQTLCSSINRSTNEPVLYFTVRLEER